jgi:hypothetical protein
LGLHVQLPMILEVDNKGAADLVNNYSVWGWTRHVEMRQYFLRQLKEESISNFIWTLGELNISDLLICEELGTHGFQKNLKAYVRDDNY